MRPVDGESLGQIIKVITTEPITPIEQVATHLPPQFPALINRMLRHDRRERPVDLREPFAVLRGLVPVTDQSGSASNWLAPSIPAPPSAVAPSALPGRARSPSGVATPVLSPELQERHGPAPKTIAIGLLALLALGFSSGLLLLRGHAAPAAAVSSLAASPPPPAEPAVLTPPVSDTPTTDTGASAAPAASAPVPHKRKRAPNVGGGFQSFNTGRK